MTKKKKPSLKVVDRILSIDIGTDKKHPNMGIAVYAFDTFIMDTYQFAGYQEFRKELQKLIEIWKPELIIYPIPTAFRSTVMSHAKVIGVIELVAEEAEIPTHSTVDSHCKLSVLGRGVAEKEDIKLYFDRKYPGDYPSASEHALDGAMFVLAYLNDISKQRP